MRRSNLPFAMAASMESTKKGRLWTCWACGQDGPNAYLLASYSDDHGKTWRMGKPVDKHTNESQVVELAAGSF